MHIVRVDHHITVFSLVERCRADRLYIVVVEVIYFRHHASLRKCLVDHSNSSCAYLLIGTGLWVYTGFMSMCPAVGFCIFGLSAPIKSTMYCPVNVKSKFRVERFSDTIALTVLLLTPDQSAMSCNAP